MSPTAAATVAASPAPTPVGRRGRARRPAVERRLLLDAMTVLASERGWSGLPMRRICERAGLSRGTFLEHFADAEDCFGSAVEDALAQLWAAVEGEVERAGPEWPAQVSAAITGFLGFLRADPPRAWMSVVEPLGGSDRVREARQVTMDRFVALLQGGPVPDGARDRAAVNTVAGTVGGLWEMARQYVSDGDGTVSVDDIAGSSIFLALTPYLGRDEAMRRAFTARRLIEVAPPPAPAEAPPAPDEEVVAIAGDLTALASTTLAYLDEHPGAANRAIAAAIGVDYESQISRHLRRLEGQGLADCVRRGRFNAWTLTDDGRRVAAYLRAA